MVLLLYLHRKITKKNRSYATKCDYFEVKDAILSMAVGDVISFPIEKTVNVRVYASNIGITAKRKYKTSVNKAKETVCVIRLK